MNRTDTILDPLRAVRARIVDTRSRIRDRLPDTVLTYLPVIAGLSLLPVGLLIDTFSLLLLNQILILGLFGIAYDLLFGYTGLLSFGHAAFFGLGAYVTAFIITNLGWPLIAILAATVVLGALLALVIGLIALRTTGVYFAMITLAIAQLLYILTIRLGDALGGASGIGLRSRPPTFLPVDLNDTYVFFVFSVAVLVVSYLALRRVLSSPTGDVLRAIRENEQRATLVGYNTFYYKLWALVVSGIFSAIAGALFAQFLFFSAPNFLFWTRSGDVLLLTLFGGVGTLLGPIIGSGFIVLIEEFLSPITDQWRLFLGVAFVVVVVLFPNGILGLVTEDD